MNNFVLYILVCGLFTFSTLRGQPDPGKPDSLFRSNEIIKMELRCNFSAIQESRSAEDPDVQEGELIYYSSEGQAVTLGVKVEPRGNFRVNPQHCRFPPLKLDFDKDKVPGTLFDNQNTIKLVTPCQHEEDVLEEYVIYKMYNTVTVYSLEVRLVEILYYDTGRDKKVFEKYSFFIEDIDHLAERMNGKEIDRRITPFEVNREVMKKMHVFQYIIGNKDWFITTRQNIKLIQPEDTSQLPVAVPYDFDFSELVDAGYTKPKGIPDEMLESRRVYKGLCYSREEFEEVFDFFMELRTEFSDMIMNMKLISRFSRKQDVKYIERFYEVIGDEELLKKEILSTCKTRKDYFVIED